MIKVEVRKLTTSCQLGASHRRTVLITRLLISDQWGDPPTVQAPESARKQSALSHHPAHPCGNPQVGHACGTGGGHGIDEQQGGYPAQAHTCGQRHERTPMGTEAETAPTLLQGLRWDADQKAELQHEINQQTQAQSDPHGQGDIALGIAHFPGEVHRRAETQQAEQNSAAADGIHQRVLLPWYRQLQIAPVA